MSQSIIQEMQTDSAGQTQRQQGTSKETPAPRRHRLRAVLLGSLFKNLPTLAVIAALGGLGYWGHRTNWTVPSFPELTGAATHVPDDWCSEHGVPESQCVACNPETFPKPHDYGWCKQHGVHQCPLHHPGVAQTKEAVEVTQADWDRAERALQLRPRAENNFACNNPGRRIQFASHESVLKAGIDVEPVQRRPVVESVSATGELRYDQTRLARLSPKAVGTVWRVEKEVGDRVRRGEILALVDAAEVGRLKAQLLAALAQEKLQQQVRDRMQGLAEKGIVPGRELQEAQAAVSQARTQVLSAEQALTNLGLSVTVDRLRGMSERDAAEQLRFLGLPEELTGQFDPVTSTSNVLPLTAPLDGVVATREVVAGEVVDTTRVLFELVDTTQMWLILNVPLEEAKYVRAGQKIDFLADDASNEVSGRIAWISTTADPRTRTVQVRANLPNADGRLRNETFGSGRIVLREEVDAIVIPNKALQWDGSCHVVFVRDKVYFTENAPKVFHTRSVRPGAKMEEFTEMIAGVLPGEVVATVGSDVLRAELLKNNLGAG